MRPVTAVERPCWIEKKRIEAEQLSRQLETVELAQETDFQRQLIDATSFPYNRAYAAALNDPAYP